MADGEELLCEHTAARIMQSDRLAHDPLGLRLAQILQPEQLRQRGISARKAQLILNAYPVLVLSNEWLEELFCPKCGSSRWCHVIKHDAVLHTVRWAPRDVWEQVAHVDPTAANPTVSEYTRRNARRNAIKRVDGKRYFD